MLAAVLAFVAATDPCAGKGTALYVNADRRGLWLCENDASRGRMRIAIGPGGVDKRREGDARVPLGEYALSPAVASRDYHLFLLVGYPTLRQRRAGYTGGAVGVHGPPRGYPHGSVEHDWTLGCMAVDTDDEIEQIAAWVKAHRVWRIVIDAR